MHDRYHYPFTEKQSRIIQEHDPIRVADIKDAIVEFKNQFGWVAKMAVKKAVS